MQWNFEKVVTFICRCQCIMKEIMLYIYCCHVYVVHNMELQLHSTVCIAYNWSVIIAPLWSFAIILYGFYKSGLV